MGILIEYYESAAVVVASVNPISAPTRLCRRWSVGLSGAGPRFRLETLGVHYRSHPASAGRVSDLRSGRSKWYNDQ